MNGEALPRGLGTASRWEILTVIDVFSCPLDGGSSIRLNMVEGGGQQLSMGPILLHFPPKGKLSGLLAGEPFLPNTVNTGSRLQ